MPQNVRETNDYDSGYAAPGNVPARKAVWTNYPSQYCLCYPSSNRKDAIRSRIRSIYNSKKAVTSTNFFKQKRALASFMTKYPARERDKPRPADSITVEQYFVEMEKRCPPLPRHTGRRGVSTAVPACRAGRDPGDLRPDYALAPIRLAKTKIARGYCTGFPGQEAEIQRIRLEQQQSYQETRPDSRYNHESLCVSLEPAGRRQAVMESWEEEGPRNMRRQQCNLSKLSKYGKEPAQAPERGRLYGQY